MVPTTLPCRARSVAAVGHADAGARPSLRALVDSSTVTTPEHLLARLKKLEAALARDGRVVFAAIYAAITKASVKLITDGGVRDVVTSRALIVDFGHRFLDAFAAHLDGRTVPGHWQRHFALAAGHPPSLRAAASAMNAHLSVDLAESILASGATHAFAADYAAFGQALAAATPDVVAALGRHGVEAAGFVKGWLLGDAIDAVAGAGTTTRLGFQTIRGEAFTSAMWMRECVLSPSVVRIGLAAACSHREALLDAVLCPKAAARRSATGD